MNSNLSVIAGLGNPEKKYSNTLHNAGFWFVDEIASQNNVEFSKDSKFNLDICQVNLCKNDIWLIKPQSYMNNSGGPIAAFLNYYKIPTFKMLVAHDEIDLSPNSIKLKIGGGHAGHNGLRDISKDIGSDYIRLRFGIGHPPNKAQTNSWVIKKPNPEEKINVHKSYKKAMSCLDDLLQKKWMIVMNNLHSDEH